jgi:hypothetical protein
MAALVPSKDDDGYERLVFAEVLIPDTPNVYGDFHTAESVRQFAYTFMVNGFGLDVNHDNGDWEGKLYVVESFIARQNDPDFVEGAWVVGMYIPDDELWGKVLRNELQGYSWEGYVTSQEAVLKVPGIRARVGFTGPAVSDGHRHSFFVLLDDDGRPVMGGTSVDNGHAHDIYDHTVTESNLGHTHLYNYIAIGDI